MSCVEIDLNAYHDAEECDRSEIDRHLQRCPDCRAELQELRALDRLLRGEGPAQLQWRPRRAFPGLLKAAVLMLGLASLLHLWPSPRPVAATSQRYQVNHGQRSYIVETRGPATQILQIDIEDEFGKARADFKEIN